PTGTPPIWKNFAAADAKRGDAFPKLASLRPNPLTYLIGALYIDEFSLVGIADTLCQPVMDPLSCCKCPCIAVVSVSFNSEKNFQPNDGRRAQRSFPVGDAEGDLLIGRTPKREFIFARAAQLPARIEGVLRPANADRIDFLRIDR